MNKLTFFVVSTLLIIFTSTPIHATSISLTPSTASVTVGDQFDMELGISGLGDLSANGIRLKTK